MKQNPHIEESTSRHAATPGNNILSLLLKFVVPAIISVGLCWILFRDDSLAEMLEIIKTKCDFVWIALMLIVSAFSNVFRAMRWGIQLEATGIKCKFSELLYSIFGTYAVNLVFPRLGEVWRTGYIANRQDANFGTVFGTMIADRFADLITGLLFTAATIFVGHSAISAFVHKYPDGYEKLMSAASSPWLWCALGIMAIIIILVLKYVRNNFINRLRNFGQELWSGFSSIATMKHKWMWLLWTLLLWGAYLGQMYLSFLAFPFTREILADNGFTPILICFTLGTIAMGIPSNGGIGLTSLQSYSD